MNARILVPVNWTLWSIMLVVLLYGLVRVSTERTSSPEAGRGLGIFAVVFLLLLLAGAAVFLNMAARKQSTSGLITMTVILAWPIASIVVPPAIKAYKNRRFAAEANTGRNAAPVSVADAISANDTAALTRLLDAGADVNAVDRRSGNTPLGDAYGNPAIVRLLVEHGADMDRIQSDGTPAVVRFIGTRQWESARYLIEKGARLDIVNSHGLSVDYYLNEWKDGVFGEHPDGWDNVRQAIAARKSERR